MVSVGTYPGGVTSEGFDVGRDLIAPDKAVFGRVLAAFWVSEEEVELTGTRDCDDGEKAKSFFDDGEHSALSLAARRCFLDSHFCVEYHERQERLS